MAQVVHPLNARRKEAGQFHTTMAELKADEERFRQYTRMSIGAFDKLVGLISHRLEKRSVREALSPEERLIVCLRILSTGDSFHSIGINFRIGFHSSGSRKYAFDGVAFRLGLMRTVHDALYGNAAFEDIRRMWRQWVRSFYAYKMRRTTRKPKFYAELSFLNELSMDQLSIAANMF
ncbi:hypothetical protein AAVH_03144 [Aphelenchoides avenae]|nr:hypothetical protein AAVH_03144 [Aphelenchus avenae]